LYIITEEPFVYTNGKGVGVTDHNVEPHTLGAKPYYVGVIEIRNDMKLSTINKYLVCITADTRDASDPKIKRRERILTTFSVGQSCLLEIRHNETPEATIDVKANVVRGSQGTEGHDVVLIAVREVDGRTYELGDIVCGQYTFNLSMRNIYQDRVPISGIQYQYE
jgi:hypothetical protein